MEERCGEKMVGEIMYMRRWEGWLFLEKVMDCERREVVGWEMDENYGMGLVTAGIEMAACDLDLVADAVFHSDRGSDYMCEECEAVLGRLGIGQWVGR